MAVFKSPELFPPTSQDEWRTYNLFRYGPIVLFFKRQVLQDSIQFLQNQDYVIHEFNCQDYTSEADFFNDILFRLKIIDEIYKGIKPVQFWDLLSAAEVPDESGLILAFTRFDVFHRAFPEVAQELLEIVAGYHYKWLWFGRRFAAFVQTDDPMIKLEPVGAHPACWNSKEWLIKDRTP